MPHAILLALVPIFFVLALGFVAGRLRTVDNHQVGGLNALVMDFALPASIVVATASAPRHDLIAQAPLFAILGVIMLILYLGWYLFQRQVLGVSRGEAALQALTIASPNFAGVGLPIAVAILGPTGTVPVALALAAGSTFVIPLSLVLLELAAAEGTSATTPSAERVRVALWHALTKPVVLAPVLGILLSLSGLTLGAVLTASLHLIGQAAAGVALFLTGLILSSQSLRVDWTVVRATAMADLLRPISVAAVVLLVPVPHEIGRMCILLAALPSGFLGILFGVTYRVSSVEVGSMVIASTLFSALTLPVTIALLYPQ